MIATSVLISLAKPTFSFVDPLFLQHDLARTVCNFLLSLTFGSDHALTPAGLTWLASI
jgi:hypothetical protein